MSVSTANGVENEDSVSMGSKMAKLFVQNTLLMTTDPSAVDKLSPGFEEHVEVLSGGHLECIRTLPRSLRSSRSPLYVDAGRLFGISVATVRATNDSGTADLPFLLPGSSSAALASILGWQAHQVQR